MVAMLTAAAVVDLLLVMTVEPGFGGQKFQEATMAKVASRCVLH
jgi:pentose-5-phosphate-3-epimerase